MRYIHVHPNKALAGFRISNANNLIACTTHIYVSYYYYKSCHLLFRLCYEKYNSICNTEA
jgi:hypothetical protein